MISCILTYVTECLIAFVFLNKTFDRIRSNACTAAAYISGYSALACLFFLHIIPVNLTAFTLVNCILIYILYMPSILISVFYSFIMTCMMGFSELLFSSITDNFDIDSSVLTGQIILFFILSKSVYFLLLLVVSHLSRTIKSFTSSAAISGMIPVIITVLTLTELFCLYHVFCEADFPASDIVLINLCCICTIITDILAVWFFDYIAEKNAELLKIKLISQSESERRTYYKNMEHLYENQQLLIHDMKNHMYSISEFLSTKNYDEASDYINSLLNSPELNTKVKYCNDIRLNNILNRYMHMSNHSLHYNINVSNSDTSFIKSEYLTSLFCNILDNATEACRYSSSAVINIKVASDTASDKLTFISVSNTCVKAPVTNDIGDFISTKKDADMHGYGLKNIQKIVHEYNGEMHAYYDKDKKMFFTLITLEDK